MKRRNFIKHGALWVPTLLLARKSSGQIGLQSPGFVGQLSKKAGGTTYTEQMSWTSGAPSDSRNYDNTYRRWSWQWKPISDWSLTKVSINLKKVGSPTGNIQAFIYESATPTADGGTPNLRLATGSTVDVSTISADAAGSYADFTFASPASMVTDRFACVVLWYVYGSATDYITHRQDNSGYDDGLVCRSTVAAEPSASGDATNWTGVDVNAYVNMKIYSSP